MNIFKNRLTLVVIMLALVTWASYALYAWIGQNGMLYCSLIGLVMVAAIRWGCKRSPSFRSGYFPGIRKGLGIPVTDNARNGLIGMWALSATGFAALAILGWWLILVTHIVMVWLIVDDVKTAVKEMQ